MRYMAYYTMFVGLLLMLGISVIHAQVSPIRECLPEHKEGDKCQSFTPGAVVLNGIWLCTENGWKCIELGSSCLALAPEGTTVPGTWQLIKSESEAGRTEHKVSCVPRAFSVGA
jgi:hypothetical protein